MKKIFSSAAIVCALLLLIYGGVFGSALWFLRSVEDRFFEAEAAHFEGGSIIDMPKASGLRVLGLAPAQGKRAELGFDARIKYCLGRVRARFHFLPNPPGAKTPASVSLRITQRGAKHPLVSRRVTAKELSQGQALVEANLDGEIMRLEFWLLAQGPGQLVVDRLQVERPGAISWWISAAGRMAGSRPWPFWSLEAKGPFAQYDLARLYQRASFLTLNQRLLAGLQSQPEKALKLFGFVQDRLAQIRARDSVPDMGDDHWDVLVRGGAQCDTQARVLGDMAGGMGLASRVTCARMIPANEGEHCFLEMALGGKWVYLDPYMGLVFAKGSPTDLAGLRDLKNRPGLLEHHPLLQKAEPDQQANIQALFNNPPRVLNNRQPWLTDQAVCPGFIWNLWSRRLQDMYLRQVDEKLSTEPAKAALVRGRHLHLWGRLAQAEAAYAQAMALTSGGVYPKAALYYLAWLDWDRGEKKQACGRLAKIRLSGPDDIWARRVKELSAKAGCESR